MIKQPICLCLNLKYGEPGPPPADHDHQVVRSAVFCLRFSWHKDRSKNAVSNTSACECALSARRGKVKPTMAFTKIGRQATASVPQLLLETATPHRRAAAHACSKVNYAIFGKDILVMASAAVKLTWQSAFCRTQEMQGDPFGLLLQQRIVFMGGEVKTSCFFVKRSASWLFACRHNHRKLSNLISMQVNDFMADAIVSQLLLLDAQDPTKACLLQIHQLQILSS